MAAPSTFTYKLSAEQQEILSEILRTGNYRPFRADHAIIAGKTPDCSIVLYKSGKCLIQGKGASEFVMFTMEPVVLGGVGLGYEKELNPEAFQPHMGVDESGKGDFFGPLVVAAAYVDEELVDKMQSMGVKDSKNISSDKKAISLGRDLRRLLGKRYSIVRIGPEAYNRLYTKMRSVNTLLAWGHARAIENLLEDAPDCPRAISDQFGSKSQVERALMKKGQKIKLVQRHKAESDIAVAAASIIAREGFLVSLDKMAEQQGVELKKGASPAVREAAEKLIKKHGEKVLLKTAKCHFKTADAVLAACGTNRAALGPEGAAVSKPYERRKPKK